MDFSADTEMVLRALAAEAERIYQADHRELPLYGASVYGYLPNAIGIKLADGRRLKVSVMAMPTYGLAWEDEPPAGPEAYANDWRRKPAEQSWDAYREGLRREETQGMAVPAHLLPGASMADVLRASRERAERERTAPVVSAEELLRLAAAQPGERSLAEAEEALRRVQAMTPEELDALEADLRAREKAEDDGGQ